MALDASSESEDQLSEPVEIANYPAARLAASSTFTWASSCAVSDDGWTTNKRNGSAGTTLTDATARINDIMARAQRGVARRELKLAREARRSEASSTGPDVALNIIGEAAAFPEPNSTRTAHKDASSAPKATLSRLMLPTASLARKLALTARPAASTAGESSLGATSTQMRLAIEAKIRTLRDDEQLRSDFDATCRRWVRERHSHHRHRSDDRRPAVLGKSSTPADAAVVAVQHRRRELHMQHVMGEEASVHPVFEPHLSRRSGSTREVVMVETDSLRLRRLCVILLLGRYGAKLLEAVMKRRLNFNSRLTGGTHHLSLAEVIGRFDDFATKVKAARTFDRFALRMSITWRILRKRRCLRTVKEFLVVRRYVQSMRLSVRTFLNAVSTCQCAMRRWWSGARAQRLTAWSEQWSLLEPAVIEDALLPFMHHSARRVSSDQSATPLDSAIPSCHKAAALRRLHRSMSHRFVQQFRSYKAQLANYVGNMRSVLMMHSGALSSSSDLAHSHPSLRQQESSAYFDGAGSFSQAASVVSQALMPRPPVFPTPTNAELTRVIKETLKSGADLDDTFQSVNERMLLGAMRPQPPPSMKQETIPAAAAPATSERRSGAPVRSSNKVTPKRTAPPLASLVPGLLPIAAAVSGEQQALNRSSQNNKPNSDSSEFAILSNMENSLQQAEAPTGQLEIAVPAPAPPARVAVSAHVRRLRGARNAKGGRQPAPLPPLDSLLASTTPRAEKPGVAADQPAAAAPALPSWA